MYIYKFRDPVTGEKGTLYEGTAAEIASLDKTGFSSLIRLRESDTGNEGYWNGTAVQYNVAGGAVSTFEQGVIAGERNIDSSTNGYLVTHEEVNYTVVTVVDDTTTVSAVPCFFYGLYVNSAIGEDLVIEDGATTVFTVLAAALTANTYVGFGNHGIRFNTSLIINPDNASTETDLIVLWRPI